MAVSAAVRELVAARAEGCCEYCKSREDYSPSGFSVEHIIPRSAGGGSHPDNFAFACQACNNFKYAATSALDPVTGMEARLFNPRLDSWSAHFCWTNDRETVLGLTPTGRATIARLRLNRPGVIRLRQVLVKARFDTNAGSDVK